MRAKRNLKNRSIQVINTHFGRSSVTDAQAEALAEFALVNHAPFGTGLSLPETPHSILVQMVKTERD